MTNPMNAQEILQKFDDDFDFDHHHSGTEIGAFLVFALISHMEYLLGKIVVPCDDEVFYDKDGNEFTNPRTVLESEIAKLKGV